MARAHPRPILSLATDSFIDALWRLDPANRALLDLSLRRGMTPEEIGEMLGSDAGSVVVAREQALQQLADELALADPAELDEVRARMAELPPEAWTPGATAEKPTEPEVREPAPPPEKRRSRLPLLLALLAIAVIALVVILASGGDGDEEASTTPTTTPSKPKPPPAKPKPPPEKAAALSPRGRASGAKGTAALTSGGHRLHLVITGLRRGAYQVWLYDSVVRARSLGGARGTKLDLDLKLPAKVNDYRYVDVSREPRDGNPNHSGQSVLRVRLTELAR